MIFNTRFYVFLCQGGNFNFKFLFIHITICVIVKIVLIVRSHFGLLRTWETFNVSESFGGRENGHADNEVLVIVILDKK